MSSPASEVPSMAFGAMAFSEAIAANFAEVRRRIEAAVGEAGRTPGSVTLTAVSKTQTDAALEAALATGQRVFGENRVQEAQAHWVEQLGAAQRGAEQRGAARRASMPDLELRLIGPLQTNKAEDAVALFDVIETLDREKLARALAEASARLGRSPRLLVQVNTGAEPQKAGVLPADAAALIQVARTVYGLSVEGLMAIPPVGEAPEPHFALLARLAADNGLAELSMGMSGDYEAAIRAGATHVRVGSALFGARKPL